MLVIIILWIRLNKKIASCDITLTPFDNNRLSNLCGKLDDNLSQIEKGLSVEILSRGNNFRVSGDAANINLAAQVLKNLYRQTEINKQISPEQVHLCIQEIRSTMNNSVFENDTDSDIKIASIKTPMATFTLRNKNQLHYVNEIAKYDICFGLGPAGTGKTFLAVASAVAALEQKKIRRIVLVRPVVEAGEKLGFLPGDLTQKIDPYLRPLYDAFHEMLDFEKMAKLLEQQIIEIAPLAYMRGRTLNDAFIILDESQNTTKEQMKMFLTRIGFNSTAVITGDLSQIDLPHGKLSGLRHAYDVLAGIKAISFTEFTSKDVVRHPIVQNIIDAYDEYELKNTRT